ncbi:MAG TPA: bacterioferritin [Candidatus Kapabacteria bacterium]|nr:bacterioferritin [Candidatus Kapabacteria bacterium]
MKAADPKIIDILNDLLKGELTAINQYFLHAEMCNSWGYKRLYATMRKESIEEMVHAEKLMERILFLEGTPTMTESLKIKVGKTVPDQFENDLELEIEAVEKLTSAISSAIEMGDYASKELFESILLEEEHHVDWLEGQLGIIKEVGIAHYLAQQINN